MSRVVGITSMFDTSDTIAAIASARGGALRGVVRVSGPEAQTYLEQLFEPVSGNNYFAQRTPRVTAGSFTAPAPIGRIPCDIYFWPTVRSYTRQPCFEVHTFGSPPVLDGVLSAVCHAGCRLAQPGEFTMRAFLAGRLDLTQAEAVLGVIDARDAVELSVALQQLAGGLTRPLHELRDRLLDLLARLEAGLDFVEEDIEFVETEEVQRQLFESQTLISALLEQVSNRAHIMAEGRVVLRGWPNVGKSSLFNVLTDTPAAIVSEQAGTTRDYVTRTVDLGGMTIQVIDTAGVESSAQGLASAAQLVTARQAGEASLQLFCLDSSRPLNAWEVDELQQRRPARLVVMTKCDLPVKCDYDGVAIRTSCHTLSGMKELRRAIKRELDTTGSRGFCIDSTAARCEESLRLAAESLARGLEIVVSRGGEELIASELRLALHELGRVAGTVYTDDILDRIFSRFCIGK
jgi:tRNA modification GTPase